MVRHSIWHTHTNEPKTAHSKRPIPIIEPLRSILAELHETDCNPQIGPILCGPTGKPLNLSNLVKRVIIPALKLKKARAEKKTEVEWRGWYALRRGIATLVSSVEKDPLAAKGLLRHASVATTLEHYVKEVPEITLRATAKVEALCNPHATGAFGPIS